MEKVIFEDLGSISYQEAWDYQTSVHRRMVDYKLAKRNQDPAVPMADAQLHHLLFCEHPPVYTLGKSGSIDHLLLNEQELEEEGFEYFKINRGGDITYHGPGQIVGYPIFDLDCFFTDVHKYVRYLEEAVMRTLADYGIESMRIKEYTGVWLEAGRGLPQRKICAIGVHLSRWVTMHGFAFNVNPTLQHFSNIIPCGIDDKDKGVTSMQQELGRELPIDEVKENLRQQFAHLFDFQFTN